MGFIIQSVISALFLSQNMSTEERSLHVTEFSGKKRDWKSWSVKFLAHGNWRGYQKLFVGEGKTVGVDIVPT